MSTSHRVDVVIAEPGTNPTDSLTPAPQHPETVDVAPIPGRRIIVVAHSKAAGAQLAEAEGFTPVAVVTPRSEHAARGIAADDIMWADDITADQRAELEPHVLPSLVAQP